MFYFLSFHSQYPNYWVHCELKKRLNWDLGEFMVKFEEIVEKIDRLSGKERAKELEKVAKDCVCPHCPSYNECADKKVEYAFCINGKSESCIDTELGCLCPTCPLAQEYQIGVMYNFYCIRGSEKEQKSDN